MRTVRVPKGKIQRPGVEACAPKKENQTQAVTPDILILEINNKEE